MFAQLCSICVSGMGTIRECFLFKNKVYLFGNAFAYVIIAQARSSKCTRILHLCRVRGISLSVSKN